MIFNIMGGVGEMFLYERIVNSYLSWNYKLSKSQRN